MIEWAAESRRAENNDFDTRSKIAERDGRTIQRDVSRVLFCNENPEQKSVFSLTMVLRIFSMRNR